VFLNYNSSRNSWAMYFFPRYKLCIDCDKKCELGHILCKIFENSPGHPTCMFSRMVQIRPTIRVARLAKFSPFFAIFYCEQHFRKWPKVWAIFFTEKKISFVKNVFGFIFWMIFFSHTLIWSPWLCIHTYVRMGWSVPRNNKPLDWLALSERKTFTSSFVVFL
jgi:hypothetical protein